LRWACDSTLRPLRPGRMVVSSQASDPHANALRYSDCGMGGHHRTVHGATGGEGETGAAICRVGALSNSTIAGTTPKTVVEDCNIEYNQTVI